MTRGPRAAVGPTLIAIVALSAAASAQSAAIGGRVMDEQGLAVSGATVTVTSPGTGFT